jgi:outer membrane protein assembly factor BamB
MAAPTPLTDGTHVYALFATGDLVCYDRDGNLAWYRSLVGDYPTVGNNVGMAASPVLWRDRVIVCLENVGESFAAGIDTKTGENRWRVDRPRGINWVTPLVIQNAGRAEVLFQGPQDLTAHDPDTGKKRWSLTGHRLSTIPSPTFGDGVLFVPGDKFLAVRPGSDNEGPKVLWQSTKFRPGYCSPLHHAGRVYNVNSNGILNCADAGTGKVLWTHRLEGSYAASPLLADGKLFLVSEEGKTTILEAVGDEPKVLATNDLRDTILASPVAADRALFLRSDRTLYCIGAKRE